MAKEVHIGTSFQGERHRKGKIGTIWWDVENHEGDVTMSVDFLQVGWLAKADVLKDVIGLLEREYYNILLMKDDANG